MAAPDTTRTEIAAEVNDIYLGAMLMRAIPNFPHAAFAQRATLQKNQGSVIAKFRRYGSLAAATTALTEGTTPTGKSLSTTDITATCLQYGDWTRITDRVSVESPDPVLTITAELFGEQQGDTNDQLVRAILAAGTTVQYASSATSRATVAAGMLLDLDEVKEAVRTLKIANAKKITRMSGVNPGQGSTPINACYIAIVHPNTTFDLKADPKFIPVEKYASNIVLLPGEVGTLDEVRFIESTNGKVFSGEGAGSIDVYATIILGAEAYGIVDVAGTTELIFKGLGSAGSADPLNQRQTMGWKEYFVAKILNDAFMVRIEHAVS